MSKSNSKTHVIFSPPRTTVSAFAGCSKQSVLGVSGVFTPLLPIASVVAVVLVLPKQNAWLFSSFRHDCYHVLLYLLIYIFPLSKSVHCPVSPVFPLTSAIRSRRLPAPTMGIVSAAHSAARTLALRCEPIFPKSASTSDALSTVESVAQVIFL